MKCTLIAKFEIASSLTNYFSSSNVRRSEVGAASRRRNRFNPMQDKRRRRFAHVGATTGSERIGLNSGTLYAFTYARGCIRE